MLLTIKLLVASIFVLTGGSVFTEWGRRHKVLSMAAAIVAIIGSYYVMQSLKEDLDIYILEEITHNDASQRPNISGRDVLYSAPSELTEQLRKGAPADTRILKYGERWKNWNYEKSGHKYAVLRPTTGNFESLIRYPQYDTPQVKIYSQKGSSWIAVVGLDIDGKESTYYINEETGEVFFARDDAKRVFWSPSHRYIVTLGGGEVDFFSLFDTNSSTYIRGDGLESQSKIFYVKNEPMWSLSEGYFIVTIEEVSSDRMNIVDTSLARIDIPSLNTTHLTQP